MALSRDELIVRMVRHVGALNKDLNDFHSLARAWPKAAKAQQYLKLIHRDYQQLEAHVLALTAEIGHMDAVTRQFTGAGSESQKPRRAAEFRTPTTTEVPKNLVQPEPANDQKQLSEEPIPQSSEEDDTPPIPTVQEIQTPPPASAPPREPEPAQHPETDPAKKRLEDMAKNLPPHLLRELRKSGLE